MELALLGVMFGAVDCAVRLRGGEIAVVDSGKHKGIQECLGISTADFEVTVLLRTLFEFS